MRLRAFGSVEAPERFGPSHWSANMPLTDTQLVVLSAAFNRANRSILPLPEHIKGGAASKVCAALLAKGLAAEVAAAKGDPVSPQGNDGRSTRLVATDAAREALGIAPDEPAPVSVPSKRKRKAEAL